MASGWWFSFRTVFRASATLNWTELSPWQNELCQQQSSSSSSNCFIEHDVSTRKLGPSSGIRVLGQPGIRTAMRSSKIKWSIMKGVKDKQKEEEIPRVVYAIGCGDCRKVYAGETRRMAAQRVKEHKSDTRLGHLDKSAVAEHAHTTGHHVHWKAMVVERKQHGRKRKVKEALHIHRMTRKDGSMNQDRGFHLSKIWLDLVQ